MYKKLTVAVIVALLLFGVLAGKAKAGLLTNGGFETGDFTGWTLTNVGLKNDFVLVANTGTQHSGDYEALLGKSVNPLDGTPLVLSPGSISQTIATTAGQAYTVSFWVANDGGTALPGNQQNGTSLFQALWNGQVMNPNLVDSPAFQYAEYSFTGIAAGDTSTIAFTFQHDTSAFHLDDVTADPVPLPGALLLFGPGLAGLALVRKRARK